ncbi:hypothetical protein DRJ17_03520 [Candidatus Woesearchaeota archaeon]|nr:MAG: hypothetical protein DRJ17_03520 [Candidatus Woesearchaeota archaeon]
MTPKKIDFELLNIFMDRAATKAKKGSHNISTGLSVAEFADYDPVSKQIKIASGEYQKAVDNYNSAIENLRKISSCLPAPKCVKSPVLQQRVKLAEICAARGDYHDALRELQYVLPDNPLETNDTRNVASLYIDIAVRAANGNPEKLKFYRTTLRNMLRAK